MLSRDETLLPAADDERLLSRAEVCRTLGLSYPTIWKLMCEGKFPAR
jgi:predicted DNA-binding transcriptional regulator AlpA